MGTESLSGSPVALPGQAGVGPSPCEAPCGADPVCDGGAPAAEATFVPDARDAGSPAGFAETAPAQSGLLLTSTSTG